MSSKARKEIYAAKESALANYRADGCQDFDAGVVEGFERALEILDRYEAMEADFMSQALNSGDGTYRP